MLFNNTNMRTAMAYTNAVGDKVYPIIVDIKKGIKSTEEVSFVSSDINTGVLSVAFIQGNDTYNVEGAEVICSIMRPDTTTLEIPCNTVNGNTIEVPLGVNGTSQDGIYSFDFKVFKGGDKIVGTPIMNYSVSLSISNDLVIEEDDRLPVLTMLITQVNELKEETRETINQANVATVASREATANAIEATNNANAVSERVSQETATAISEIKQDTENAIATMNQNTSDAISTMTQKTDEAIANMNQNTSTAIGSMTQKTDEAVTMVNNNLANINNTVTTKVAELDDAKSDMTNTVSNKVNEVETRFNALTSSQQQDAEVIDARDGETSLKARLDRDIEKAKQVYANVEGSHISTDSSSGYAKDVEILGNTIQSANNLADIRSVGDTVEGQELYEIPVLSRGKNLLGYIEKGGINEVGNEIVSPTEVRSSFIKVKSNSKLFYSRNGVAKNTWWICYDISKKFISKNSISSSFTIPSNCSYIRILHSNTEIDNLQLEYDTRTEYEPYQEDKLTILSPVQLEKVGDVADRLIEKDGVWGVEKNILLIDKNKDISSISQYTANTNTNVKVWTLYISPQMKVDTRVLLSKFNSVRYGAWESVQPNCASGHPSLNNIYITTSNEIDTIEKVKEYLDIILVESEQPQFIPLPHDQQVKLRTFAGKTNISFGCEIEGTIKAQVPKSLGATVNTHTEQINNLNKELDRVKKLEESTVSTVTTESGFTTVEATSNGYFEDVKLEGRTLVNLANQPMGNGKVNGVYATVSETTYTIKPLTEYTYIIKNNGQELVDLYLNNQNCFPWTRLQISSGDILISKATSIAEIKGKTWLSVGVAQTMEQNLQVVLLEGDHTQNPPSYFEGLKSVGQSATTSEDGVDEIVVSSVNENLFDVNKWIKGVSVTRGGIQNHYNGSFTLSSNANDCHTGIITSGIVPFNERCKLTNIEGINKLTVSVSKNNTSGSIMFYGFYDKEFNVLGFNSVRIDNLENTHIITNNYSNAKYFMLRFGIEIANNSITFSNIIVSRGTTPKPYTSHQSDKKRLLYYNEETQAWEKPILRQWDSIEKHANGKYYYHQRSGEMVLNGSENWIMDNNNTRFGLYNINSITGNVNVNVEQISDKFSVYDRYGEKIGSFGVGTGFVRIQNNFGFTTATELKQWLQTNNATVVYQLEEEKVYECTNIDLITYANETNYIVESGVLSPKTTLKVHNNISNVVSLLQKKVSLLESNVKASQEVQDMMILETDMRMLDIELALMEFVPMKLNLGGNDMLRSATYFNFLKNHIINETYEKEYLENVMNKYLATGRINQDEYDELYKMLYPPVYDIELPIEI